MTAPRRKKYNYVTLKVTPESRAIIDEVKSSNFWFHVYVKDIIAITWPRCPVCDGPLVQKFASANLLCVRCRAEFRLRRMSRLLHEELIERGYNVVPTDSRKQPLAPRYRECYDRHCPELVRLFEDRGVKKKQMGLALLGRINPFYPTDPNYYRYRRPPPLTQRKPGDFVEGTWCWLDRTLGAPATTINTT